VSNSPLAGNEFKRRFSIVGDLKLEFAFVILQASAQQKNIRGIIFYDENLRGRHSTIPCYKVQIITRSRA
jgi:hypothetical protein